MTGDTQTTIAGALAAAQMEMGKALKLSSNPHLKNKYADLQSVMDACMNALNSHGIAVIQPSGFDETGHYVETVFLHISGERLSCRVPMLLGKQDMQGLGSAMTYARRYGLMAMAGVAPEDDDGECAKGNGKGQTDSREPPRKAEPEVNWRDYGEKIRLRVAKTRTIDEIDQLWQSTGPERLKLKSYSAEIHDAVVSIFHARRGEIESEPEAEPDKPRIATIVAAKQSLQRAVDLPRLKAIWESLPKQVQTWPGVLEEKDARKTQLAAQEAPSESAAFDDEIPY